MSETAAGTTTDYRILGPVEVWTDGHRVALGGARATQFLGLLLTEPDRLFGLDRIIEALWDDGPPSTARQQIHTTVARLRRALRAVGVDDVVETDGAGYRARVDPAEVDAGRFHRLVRDAAAAIADGSPIDAAGSLERALAEWRGPALSGASTPVIAAIAAGLDEQRLAAVERLAEVHLATGADHDDLIADLRTWSGRHPLRERLREHLILALYRSGRRADALDEFDRIRRLLSDDLGLDPGPALAALHGRILGDDPELLRTARAPGPSASPGAASASPGAAAVPGPTAAPAGPAGTRARTDGEDAAHGRSMLPAPTSDFTGRGAELAVLLATLPDVAESAGVVTIDGMAGVGKTAMAVQTAHTLAAHYPDAQLFVDLHGHTPGRGPIDVFEALDVLLRGLGVAPEQIPGDLNARSARWRSELGGRRALVVLDNAADSAQVRPLLPGGSGTLAVVTSRRRLTGLDSVAPLSLDVLTPDAAADLFVAVAGPRTVDPAEIADVVELCGHLPLAIRLAAAKLRHRPAWTVAHLIDRLRDEGRRLSRLSAEDRSVPAAFAVSYDHLQPDRQRMFRLLGLHPGIDVDAYAAAALAGVDVDRAETLLEDLLDHSLLLQIAADRYTLHDLLRRHARDIVDRDEPESERDTAVHRVLDYYLAGADRAAIVSQTSHRLRPPAAVHQSELPDLPDHGEAIAWLASEGANLVAAAECAAERGYHLHSVWLPRSLGIYILNWCVQAEWKRALRMAVVSARRLADPALEAASLNNLGSALEYLGALDEAMATHEKGLAIAVDIGDETLQATSLGNLGSLLAEQGHIDEALVHLRRTVDLHHRNGNVFAEAVGLVNLGSAVGKAGAVTEELELLRKAETIAVDHGLRAVAIGVHINAGTCHLRLEQFDQAETRFRTALAMVRNAGDPRALPAVLNNLGRLCQATGRHSEAIQHLGEALGAARSNGIPGDEARVLNRLADAERVAGRVVDARRHAEEALALSRRHGHRIEEAQAHDVLAAARRDTSDHAGAREHWQLALTIYTEAGTPDADRIRAGLEALDATRTP